MMKIPSIMANAQNVKKFAHNIIKLPQRVMMKLQNKIANVQHIEKFTHNIMK